MDTTKIEGYSTKPKRFGWKIWRVVRRHILIISTVTAAVLGFGFGFAIRQAHPSQNALIWIGLPGELYMRMLKMMIVPLVISSIISGTTSLDPKSNGKVSAVGFTYIFITNTIGALIGLAGGLIAQPGRDGNLAPSGFEQPTSQLQTQDIFVDLIRWVISLLLIYIICPGLLLQFCLVISGLCLGIPTPEMIIHYLV